MTDQAQQTVELRPALIGGFKREGVFALQDLLTQTQGLLTHANERLDEAHTQIARERDQHSTEIGSLHSELAESRGWAQRLPLALSELRKLVAGEADEEGLVQRLAQAIHECAGRHLLASVEISDDDLLPAGLEEDTKHDNAGRPSCTRTHLGKHVVTCVWKPGADASAGTVWLVEALCRAALFSLVGTAEAKQRETRGIVTQLGDACALRRHLALRERLGQPTCELSVEVDEASAGKHRRLFGEVAWDACFADAGATLEEIAHRYGGQTYQIRPLSFRLLVDRDPEAEAHAEVEERLGACELDFDVSLVT